MQRPLRNDVLHRGRGLNPNPGAKGEGRHVRGQHHSPPTMSASSPLVGAVKGYMLVLVTSPGTKFHQPGKCLRVVQDFCNTLKDDSTGLGVPCALQHMPYRMTARITGPLLESLFGIFLARYACTHQRCLVTVHFMQTNPNIPGSQITCNDCAMIPLQRRTCNAGLVHEFRGGPSGGSKPHRNPPIPAQSSFMW